MIDYGKSLLKSILRKAGVEIHRYRPQIPPEERCITLRQLTSVYGEIGDEEARFLGDLVRRAPKTAPILEIGTLFGWSARVMALAKALDQPLITVDSFTWNPWGLTREEHQWITAQMLERVARLNVQQLVMDKNQFYSQYDGPAPALVFADAGHSYEETRQDIEFAKRVGASIICGHDYMPDAWPGLVRAVDELGGPRELVGSLWAL